MIGMDLQPTPQLVSSLALTTSRWGLDYTTDVTDAIAEGTCNIGVTMVHPYLSWLATNQLSLWAIFGYGCGTEHDHDVNAACSNLAARLVERVTACGAEINPVHRFLAGKQEPVLIGPCWKGARTSKG